MLCRFELRPRAILPRAVMLVIEVVAPCSRLRLPFVGTSSAAPSNSPSSVIPPQAPSACGMMLLCWSSAVGRHIGEDWHGTEKGGYGAKACVIADSLGRAIAFVLAPGQAHELPHAVALLDQIAGLPKWVIADRGYSSHAFGEHISNRMGIAPVDADHG